MLATMLLLLFVARIAPQEPADAPATVTLAGRVVDLRGEGVPVAEVWVTSNSEERLARSFTDAEGFFRIGRVPQRDWWTVWAKADGRCRGSDFARSTEDALDIVLHDATTVRGVLLDPDGKPLGGIRVAGSMSGRALFLTEQGTTDDEGKFAIEAMPLGDATFSAWVPGKGLYVVHRRVIGDDTIALQPLDDATTAMTISIDGLPAKDRPEVVLHWLPYSKHRLSYLPEPLRRPVLTANEWQIENIPDWRYVVRLQAPGFAFEPNEIKVAAGTGPHQLGFVAKQVGAASLAWPAIVRNADGEPVAGVKLVMRRGNGGAQAEASSDEQGKLTFQSPIAAGTKVIVYATDQRWVLDQVKVGDVQGGHDRRFLVDHECVVAPEQTLELRVVPACMVTGKLLLADGRPAVGVAVQLEGESANRWPRWMSFARATTDLTGSYRFANQHHSSDAVRVHVEGRSGDADGEPFVFDTAGTVVNVPPLQLSPTANVEGVVLDGDGKPAPGVAIWLRDWDMQAKQQRSGSVTEVISDRHGRYRFLGVPLGGAWLQIADPVSNQERAVVDPFEVESGKTYEFELHDDAK